MRNIFPIIGLSLALVTAGIYAAGVSEADNSEITAQSQSPQNEDGTELGKVLLSDLEATNSRIAAFNAELKTVQEKKEQACGIKVDDFLAKNYEGHDDYETTYKHQKCLSDKQDELLWNLLARFKDDHQKRMSSGSLSAIAAAAEKGFIKSSGKSICDLELNNYLLEVRNECADYLTPPGDSVENKVIADAVTEYFIVRQHGGKTDRCVHAGAVAAAYLQTHNTAEYKTWKSAEQTDCGR